MLVRLLSIVFLAWISMVFPAASDDAPPTDPAAAREAEFKAAAAAADAAAVAGPRDIKLRDEGVLHLPAETSWVPHAEADRFMQAAGHQPDPDLLGIISGSTAGHGWAAIVSFIGEGFVKDDDAKDLDAGKLLASLREGANEQNKSRVDRGFLPLVVDDWMQQPRYDAVRKQLVWALPVHTSENADKPTINYNTRTLGRKGYISLNLLTDREHFAAEKGAAVALLKDIEYAPGHRYVDFNPSTDHVAAYGLAALIGVVALKKLGLIAIASAFVLKFAKLGFIAVIALLAGLKRLFSGRKKGDAA